MLLVQVGLCITAAVGWIPWAAALGCCWAISAVGRLVEIRTLKLTITKK